MQINWIKNKKSKINKILLGIQKTENFFVLKTIFYSLDFSDQIRNKF